MKKVVIFGGSGGLGSKVVEILKDTYTVISLNSKDVDVSDYSAVETFFKNNQPEIVINLTGVNFDSFIHKINQSSLDTINKQIDINIKGTINIISNCLKYMRENKFGRIITISSVLAEKPVVSTGVYAGCKGFIDSFVKTVALENASKNISCNSIQLGYFDAGLTYKIPETFREHVLNTIPTNRWGSIQELTNLIEFLINTPYVTGTNIKINGGIDF
jgi:NAD(P)-dependent dehydrogenase (short-subunit alcohol dehydrogenase family)